MGRSGVQVTFAGVAQFLTANLAGGQGYTEDPPGSILMRHFHFNTMGFYVQDDWRVTPRLTLNLGMRYEPTTTYGRKSMESRQVYEIYLTDATTTIGPPFRNPSLRNLSPRFGFAWDVFGNGRTALRGGFAVLYDLATLGAAANSAGHVYPAVRPRRRVSRPAPSRYRSFSRPMLASQARIAGRCTTCSSLTC